MIKRETSRALRAFEDYFGMGATRSLDKLLQRYSDNAPDTPTQSIDTLKRWSASHNWPARVRDREIKVSEKTEARVTDAVADMRARQAALGYELQDKGIERLRQLDPDEISTRDAIAMITEGAKLEQQSRGEKEAASVDVSIVLASAIGGGAVDESTLSQAIFGRFTSK